MKKCSKCKSEKQVCEFHKDRKTKDGLRRWCKSCSFEYSVIRRKSDPEKAKYNNRKNNLKSMYGITLEQYDKMILAQNGLCAICQLTGSDRGLFVDHNHDTGNVRGLLCSNCNFAIGLLNDSSDYMLRASAYLLKYEK